MPIRNFYYKSNIDKAVNLRNNPTPGERKLWKYLRKSQLNGFKFKRQQVFLNYIIDFYCKEIKLAIEIDGSSHDDTKYNYDKRREENLKSLEITFLRFTEYEIMTRIDEVLESIYQKSLSLNRIKLSIK